MKKSANNGKYGKIWKKLKKGTTWCFYSETRLVG